jgi:predicted RNA-binding protein with PIN domain
VALRLIIDAYNFLWRSETYGGGWNSMEMAMEALLEDLRRYKRIRGFSITLVFDGDPSRGGSMSREKGIRLIYSRGGRSADDLIRDMIRHAPEGALVVTSDGELSRSCRRLGASVISSENFEKRLTSALLEEMKGVSWDNDEEDDSPGLGTRKRGPARRPKKKVRKEVKRIRQL